VVWLCADTHDYIEGGGHFWVYLNWALGLRAAGCEVVWLEVLDRERPTCEVRVLDDALACRLEPYDLPHALALGSTDAGPLLGSTARRVELDSAREADLLINVAYEYCEPTLPLFRRTAMLDIDPGLTQMWHSEHGYELPSHDLYFTIGETVGHSGARFSSGRVPWRFTAPCVALERWPPVSMANGAFTTISSWWTDNWLRFDGQVYANDKRSGFLPFIELPSRTSERLELALCLGADPELRLDPGEEEERSMLLRQGWNVVHAVAVAATPGDYQSYIQGSRGEFGWAKPSCILLQNAWVSDRTLCYLASGKPAIVRHTGASNLLPDSGGLHRFHDLDGAAQALERVASDYDKECRLARELAQEHFDARRVVGAVLEQAL
jgi:hypothetical protein